jgi:hypothetical protein
MTEDVGCKIDSLTERLDFDEYESRYDTLDEHMVARWLGKDRPSEGYRSIATWFNKRIIRRTYERAGRETTGARIDSEYEALVGEDSLLREEVIDDLEAGGIDAERLTSSLVSWGTVRNHLKECINVNKEVATADTDWERRSVEKAATIVTEKTEKALTSLSNKDSLPGGNQANVEIQVLLSCPECPIRVPFADAVDRGFVCPDHLGRQSTDDGSAGDK